MLVLTFRTVLLAALLAAPAWAQTAPDPEAAYTASIEKRAASHTKPINLEPDKDARVRGRNHQLTQPPCGTTTPRLNIGAVRRMKVPRSVGTTDRTIPASTAPRTVQVLGMSAESPPDGRTIILHIAVPFKRSSWPAKFLNHPRGPGSCIARQ